MCLGNDRKEIKVAKLGRCFHKALYFRAIEAAR